MKSSLRFTKLWHSAIPTVAVAAGPGFSAEMVLRLLILKHVRNWSYQVLEREVRANFSVRDFTRVGGEDALTRRPWDVGGSR